MSKETLKVKGAERERESERERDQEREYWTYKGEKEKYNGALEEALSVSD